MGDNDRRNIAILALLILTPLTVVPHEILFNMDTISHILLSFIIATVYYYFMTKQNIVRALVLQTFTVCITIGVLKELVMDARIEWSDILADLLGTSIAIRVLLLKD